MTILAELPRSLVSVQCDLCIPPVLTINTRADLRRTGWDLSGPDQPWDVCPGCAARIAPRDRVPRGDPEPVPPEPARLPNLVVVGAAKAGTTSMHNYLALHPDIATSQDKEVRFFQDPDCRRWLGSYQSQFAGGTRYRAESTPFYSKAPCFPGVVDRMAELIPDARIVYIVRDPVERIVAEYAEQLQWHAASRPLEVELADAEDPANWLVAPSRYATQLREYQRRFAPDRIMVIDLAELSADTASVLERVFDFLELAHAVLPADDLRPRNTRADKQALPAWVHALRRGPIVRTVRRLPERPRLAMSRFVLQRLKSPVETPRLSPATLAELRRILQPEVDDLRELTGAAFATWSR